MIYIRKLRSLFLFAGLEKEEYVSLIPVIREKNRELLRVFSLLGAVFFFLLSIASLLSGGFASANSITYLQCGIGMLIILFCSWFVLPKHTSLSACFVIVFELLLYAFGIRISLLHAEKAAVSAVAFLLVAPLLFYDQPARLSLLTAGVTAVFCLIVSRVKTPDVAEADIWNMITFAAVAIAATVFMMSLKLRSLLQSRQIEHMSQTDLLTGVKNRNFYENRLNHYPEMCATSLTCIYADVNGLHEMNYREGHSSGDRMLCEVASALMEHFGSEHVYRVGGDEFVAFRTDGQQNILLSEISHIKQELGQKGYHVSIGTSFRLREKEGIDMNEMVSEAESCMFSDKREFYSHSENDRRSR